MSVETALRRHTEHQWPEPWTCHDDPISFANHKSIDDSEWKIAHFPIRRPQVVESRVVAARDNTLIELRRLADEWKAATLFMSSTQEQFLHPAYQQIIGFGEKALPFLIDELRVSDDYWFWALSMITRTDPVPDNQNGNYEAMKQAWLDWAADHNL